VVIVLSHFTRIHALLSIYYVLVRSLFSFFL